MFVLSCDLSTLSRRFMTSTPFRSLFLVLRAWRLRRAMYFRRKPKCEAQSTNFISAKDRAGYASSYQTKLRAANVRSRHDCRSVNLPAPAFLRTPAAAYSADNGAGRPRKIRLSLTLRCLTLPEATARSRRLPPAPPVLLRKARNRQSRFHQLPALRRLARQRPHNGRKSRPVARNWQTPRPLPA